jgi:predicted phage terminase large subunit-like protein
MFIVATRWHTDDLCGRVEEMNNEGRGLPWYVINLPAFAEDEDDALGRAEGEPLWPDFYTTNELDNLRETLPARDWNSLYRGKPMDTIGGIISSETFNRYRSLPEPMLRKRTILSVDSANKDNERADYTALTVWIEDGESNHYLKHVVRKRVEFNDMVRMVEATARVHNVDAILIEDKGSGTQYIQTRSGKAPAPVIGINVANLSKQFRFDAVTPLIEAGQVYLPMRAEWLALYEAELIAFPSGKYDDQVDSTSQYLDWSRTTVKRGVVRLEGLSTGTQPKLMNRGIAKSIEKGMLLAEDFAKEDPIARQLRDRGLLIPLRGNK